MHSFSNLDKSILWNGGELAIVCIWYGEVEGGQEVLRCYSFCVISDNLQFLIDKICQFMPTCTVSDAHFWSDVCAAQFECKFCFHMLASFYPSDLHTRVTLNQQVLLMVLVGSSTIYCDVKPGQVVIQSAAQFVEYANERVQKLKPSLYHNKIS